MSESSLRRGLAVRVTAAIITLLLLDSLACYYTAAHFANLVYDRWLIDSARSLSKAIGTASGKVTFELPHVGLDVFQFDEVDKTYFRVSSRRQGFITGSTELPEATTHSGAEPELDNATINRNKVRVVTTTVPIPGIDVVNVTVAETLNKRAQLTTDILLAMIAPQVGILIIALLLAWFGVSRGLKPLTDLAAQIEARGQGNLAPVPDRQLPREARTLVSKINDLLSRLERAMSAQKRFVADAAHQLRTPLAAILLYTERAQRAAHTPDEQAALKGLHAAAERTARLSRQLLTLARAEPEAPASIELKPIDLVTVARSIGEEWIPRALAEDIDFGLSAPNEPVIIGGHAGLLGEMLSNLIDNAFRYSGRASHITVSVVAVPPTLSVEDDGPGIPIEERDKIFARFHRIDPSGAHGAGLGLAIVREIANVHGASVAVGEGLNGKGARFSVRFDSTALKTSS